jgi:4-carboxymuconolactone decarboxylase
MNRNRGLKVLDEMLGTEGARDVRRNWQKICPDFEKYVVEFLSGEVWARPRLSRKIKSLCTIAALAALGRNRGLELNIRMARNNGASREEIQETLLQIAPYAGFPAAWEALVLANQVFETNKGDGRKSAARGREPRTKAQVLALDRTSRLRDSKN